MIVQYYHYLFNLENTHFLAGHYVLSLSQPTRLVHFPVRILYGYHFTEYYQVPAGKFFFVKIAGKFVLSFSGATRQTALDMDMDTLLNLHGGVTQKLLTNSN
jgi:hypothetical protein